MAENTAKKQRGKPFPKGVSGNPNGKPKGCRNKATLAAMNMLEGEGDALMRKAIDLALEGDVPCLKLCIERLCPVRKDVPISVSLPELDSQEDVPKVSKAILRNVAKGNLTPAEGQTMLGLLEMHARVIASLDLSNDLENYSPVSAEEMWSRRKQCLDNIQAQREVFLPQRREEVLEMKRELVETKKIPLNYD